MPSRDSCPTPALASTACTGDWHWTLPRSQYRQVSARGVILWHL